MVENGILDWQIYNQPFKRKKTDNKFFIIGFFVYLCIMKKDQFGSTEKYKMLGYLTEHINSLDKNKKEYLSTYIRNFNSRLKKFDSITDFDFKKYLLDLTLKSYFKSIDKLRKQKAVDNNNKVVIAYKKNIVITVNSGESKTFFDEKILSYLENYIKARINNAREVKYIVFDGHTYMISDEKIRKNDLYIYYYSGNNGSFINTANGFVATSNGGVCIKPTLADITRCKKLVYIK